MLAGAVILASALLQAAPAQAAPAPAAAPGGTLADKLELATRACAAQVSRRNLLDAKNQRGLAQQGITLGTPPQQVLTTAARLFGDKGIYASVRAPQGTVWIAASATIPACQTTVLDTDQALVAKDALVARLGATTPWRKDPARSFVRDNVFREMLVLSPEKPGAHMVLMVDGPTVPQNQGRGLQLVMTLAVEPAKAP